MRPRMENSRELLALPWPDDVPVLAGKDLNGNYGSLGHNRLSLREWIKAAFHEGLDEYEELRDQFTYVFYEVMQENCDPRDRDRITLANAITTADYQVTYVPYGVDEAAAWWNEALRRVGYDIEE